MVPCKNHSLFIIKIITASQTLADKMFLVGKQPFENTTTIFD